MIADPQNQLLPSLREDLQLVQGARDGRGGSNWLIYDPVRHRYFQIDQNTYDVLADWQPIEKSVFLTQYRSTTGRHASTDEIDSIVQFLFANSLTVEAPEGDVRAYVDQIAATQRSGLLQLLHACLFFKVPLVRPHTLLVTTLPLVAPLFTRAAFVLIVAITLSGVYLVSRQWQLFTTTFLDFLSLEGALLYAACLIAVKSLHELGHAYTATRYGVRVNTMGVAFMFLMPVLYTDVTEAWKLRSRRQMLAIAGAGITVELAIAGLATFCWVFLSDGPMRSAAFVLATTSWVLSLLINLNPFMKFDGYYLLADGLGIANLQSRAFAMARWWLREVLFGLGVAAPEMAIGGRRAFLICFAIGTWIYRLMLFIGIALLVYHVFFKVLGIALFVVAIAWFVARPVLHELKEWWKMRDQIATSASSYLMAAFMMGFIALAVVPWNTGVRAPAVVLAQQEFDIFAPLPAQIVEVNIPQEGAVAQAAPLVVLKSTRLEYEIERARQSIDLAEVRLRRVAGDERERAARTVIREELASARAQLRSLLEQQKRLILSAPFSGSVRDQIPNLAPGDWIGTTTRIGRLVSNIGRRAHGYVHEDDVSKIRVGQAVTFIPEDPTMAHRTGRLIDIARAGAYQLDIAYLSSVYGGSIASDRIDANTIKPRAGQYLVQVAIDDADINRVVRGTLHLEGHPESFATAVWRRVLQVLVRESGV